MLRGGYSVIKIKAAAAAALACALAFSASGCFKEVDPFPAPGNATESALIIRNSNYGPIVIVFTPYPLKRESPPDGVHLAVINAMGGMDSSIGAFHWPEKNMAERWLEQQIAVRNAQGLRPQVILTGHSLGATTAAETAKDIMENQQNAVITLLLTVDAVKTGRISSAAGRTGAYIAGTLPGAKISFTAYDGAPAPDGMRLIRHINYYQKNGEHYGGAPMPHAENHLLSDPTGFLNHGNADDFARPLITRDIRNVLRPGGMR